MGTLVLSLALTASQKVPCDSSNDDLTENPTKMAANRERTFIMLKPDGVQRGLVGEIIKRFEARGFKLVAMKMIKATEDHAKQHYLDLKDTPFYAGLCAFMSSGPTVAMVWEGQSVVKLGRMMLGE